MKKRDFGKNTKGEAAVLYTFENKNGMTMEVTDFGATLYSLCVPDKDGNFYCLFGDYLQKINTDGEYLWQIKYEGEAYKISFIDGDLFFPIRNNYNSTIVTYGENTFESSNADSYFLLKIDKDNGSIKNSFELEADDFVKNGFDPFSKYRDGYAISDEGDLFFMFDINEHVEITNNE